MACQHTWVILCLEVRELYILYVCSCTQLWYQVFLSNTNNLQTDLFDPLIGLSQVLLLHIRVNLEGYFTLSRASGHPFCRWQVSYFSAGDSRFVWHPTMSVWHKAISWWGPCTNQDLCMGGEKILDPVSIPLMGHLRHQAINLIPLK